MKKRRHLPNWVFIVLLAVLFLLCMVSMVIGTFWDESKEKKRLSDSFESGMEQKTKDWENERTQGGKNNPQIRLQLEGWAGVLESTGLYVPKEAVESDPYRWLLMYMAAQGYDQEGTAREYSKFCNREWKEQFEKKTGLKLKSC